MANCAQCSLAFESKLAWQKYCSKSCAMAACNGRRGAEKAEKQCRVCKQELALNLFRPSHPACRECEDLRDARRKRCRRCREIKGADQFHAQKGGFDGIASWCKLCLSESARERNARSEVRLRHRNRRLMSRYGITPEEYDRKLHAQGGACAICGGSPGPKKTYFCVDHDHNCCQGESTCGKCVRALLCVTCNTSLGLIGDSVDKAQMLIDYLRSYSNAPT